MRYAVLMRHFNGRHSYVAGIASSLSAAHRIGEIEAQDRGSFKYHYEVARFLRLDRPDKFRARKPHEPPARSRYMHRLTVLRSLSNYKRGGHWATHC